MKQTLISIILIVLLTFVGAYAVKTKLGQWKLDRITNKLNDKLMEANLELGKAKTSFGNAEEHIKNLEDTLLKNIEGMNAKITDYGRLSAKYNVLKKDQKGTIDFVEGYTVETQQDYTPGSLWLAQTKRTLAEIKSLPGTYKDHRIEINVLLLPRQKDGLYPDYLWTYKMNLLFKAELIRTITPEGALNNYLNLWEYDSILGKKLGKLEILDFTVVSLAPNKNQFFLWNPHLDLGAAAGWESLYKPTLGATIGLSAMGYGKTKNDLVWRFLRIGANLSDNIGVDFTPILWNAGTILPLFSNIWIGPFYKRGLNSNNSLGLSLNVVM